jgi:hypothetical protein
MLGECKYAEEGSVESGVESAVLLLSGVDEGESIGDARESDHLGEGVYHMEARWCCW